MSLSNLLNDPNVKSLIETMNLEAPKFTLNCSEYEYDPQGEAIVITEIQIMNLDGTVKRLADLDKILPHLASYHVTFNHK